MGSIVHWVVSISWCWLRYLVWPLVGCCWVYRVKANNHIFGQIAAQLSIVVLPLGNAASLQSSRLQSIWHGQGLVSTIMARYQFRVLACGFANNLCQLALQGTPWLLLLSDKLHLFLPSDPLFWGIHLDSLSPEEEKACKQRSSVARSLFGQYTKVMSKMTNRKRRWFGSVDFPSERQPSPCKSRGHKCNVTDKYVGVQKKC